MLKQISITSSKIGVYQNTCLLLLLHKTVGNDLFQGHGQKVWSYKNKKQNTSYYSIDESQNKAKA